MSTLIDAPLEFSVGLMTLRGAFKIGATGAVGAIADGNSKCIKAVVRVSKGVYEVEYHAPSRGCPYLPTQILTPLCGMTADDIVPATGEAQLIQYVTGSWNRTTRKFRLVVTGTDDQLVEDPDNGCSVWFAFTGPYNPASVDKGFTL